MSLLFLLYISYINFKKKVMSLSENSGSIFSQTVAESLITSFDQRFQGEIISSFIGANHVKSILAQKDCIGIRIYNGYDAVKGKISLIIVGVDKEQKDLLGTGLIYDDMITCPPTCPIDGLFPKK